MIFISLERSLQLQYMDRGTRRNYGRPSRRIISASCRNPKYGSGAKLKDYGSVKAYSLRS
jgi:hypothetical protein